MFEEICLCFLSLLGTEMVDKAPIYYHGHGDFMSNNRIVLVLRNKPLSRLEMQPYRHHGPLTRYGKMRVAPAPGMPGTFSPPPSYRKPLVSDPGMHHGTEISKNNIWLMAWICTYIYMKPWDVMNHPFLTSTTVSINAFSIDLSRRRVIKLSSTELYVRYFTDDIMKKIFKQVNV